MAGNQAWIEEIEGMVSSLSCSADQLNSGLDHDGASLLRELRVGLNQLVLGIARARNAGYTREGRVALHHSHSLLKKVARIVDRMGHLPTEYRYTLATVRRQVVQLLIDFKLALQSGLKSEDRSKAYGHDPQPAGRALLRPWTSGRTRSDRRHHLDHTARIRRYIRPLAS